ncbi:MAG: tyrosine--tRNA ligase [Nanoarchaeota archaeon]|nr:tyrosine--tRNA ligase [Nanoarchaeota archaeon]
MNLEERMEIARRNAEEVCMAGELKELLEKKKAPVAYCGYEVSGEVHLGHLITAVKLMDLKNIGFNVKILLADWHTYLNKKGNWDYIHELSELWRMVFTAFGFDKSEFVLGSTFQKKPEYIENILEMSTKVTINRGLRSMQEVARDIENAKVSQVIYPFMQIEDIKSLGVDVAVSGIDQRKIHMLARELLPAVGYNAPVCIHMPIISLKGEEKMSSSKPETIISVRDSPEDIRKKINRAYCPPQIAEGNSVMDIAKLLVIPSFPKFKIERDDKFGSDVIFENAAELEKTYKAGKLHPADLKRGVTEHLTKLLDKTRRV